MGCVQSRKDINDVHPNVFRVINIDEDGNELWVGQLELTDGELTLYRRGKEPTRWPLRSLRRYGFDEEVFSFESGRRGPTGQGIYAFRCRRAEQLFNTLQRFILDRNTEGITLDTLALEGPRLPGTLPRPPPDHQPTSHADYLDPAPPTTTVTTSRFSGTIRLGSVSSGPLSPEVHSPGSPSSTNILEVMPLAPLPSVGAQVTNLYQFQDFSLQREHNNNKKINVNSTNHSYSNTHDINSDLATLRHSLQNRQYPNNDETSVDANELVNQSEEPVPLSPAHSTSSEHYATLAVERETDDRLYMNLAPGEIPLTLPAIREETGGTMHSYSLNLHTPNSATQVSKLSEHFSFVDRMEDDEEKHNYANLGLTEVKYDPRLISRQRSKLSRGVSLDIPPVLEESNTKIKYAVLDLQSSKAERDGDNAQGLLPNSPKKTVVGYTTIDFNKTVALKSVALEMEGLADSEGVPSRKSRHNSTAQPPNPSVT